MVPVLEPWLRRPLSKIVPSQFAAVSRRVRMWSVEILLRRLRRCCDVVATTKTRLFVSRRTRDRVPDTTFCLFRVSTHMKTFPGCLRFLEIRKLRGRICRKHLWAIDYGLHAGRVFVPVDLRANPGSSMPACQSSRSRPLRQANDRQAGIGEPASTSPHRRYHRVSAGHPATQPASQQAPSSMPARIDGPGQLANAPFTTRRPL